VVSPVRRDDATTGIRLVRRAWRYPERMAEQSEFEFVFEPQDEGGYHVYAPDLPGLHTQGEDIDDAVENAQEALALYVEGLREEGRPVGSGIVRRRLAVPA
jgi:predicted RNase H-like HicB family nuclease